MLCVFEAAARYGVPLIPFPSNREVTAKAWRGAEGIQAP